MPRVLTDHDLKDLAKKGRLPKGLAVIQAEKTAQEGAMAEAKGFPKEKGEDIPSILNALLLRLKELGEPSVTVNVPEIKVPADWTEADVEIVERDFFGSIKRVKIRKVK